MQVNIHESWKHVLAEEFNKEYFANLQDFITKEYENTTCYPVKEEIFSAFNHCLFNDMKVVIIGQDPYHGEGQANGLCFSVKDGIKQPPSLVNIFKELNSDLGIENPASGDLSRWGKQGVFLLNTTLTVRESEPGSHQKQGWETFTDHVISIISKEKENVVFLLWGKFGQSKSKLIDTSKHKVFTAPHPSPLGAWRGWFGSKHFSKTNVFLKEKGFDTINW